MKKTIYILIAVTLIQGCDAALKGSSDQPTNKEKKRNRQDDMLSLNLDRKLREDFSLRLKNKEYLLLNNKEEYVEIDIDSEVYNDIDDDDDDYTQMSCNQLIYIVLQEEEQPLVYTVTKGLGAP